jgi:hypothetical protein
LQNFGGAKVITDQNNHPQRQLYYLGAKVLELLSAGHNSVEFFQVYQQLKKNEKISIKLFTLTLDWLFLLGVISLEKGIIKKCS